MSLLRLPVCFILLVGRDNARKGSSLGVFDALHTSPIAFKHPYLYIRQLEALPTFSLR